MNICIIAKHNTNTLRERSLTYGWVQQTGCLPLQIGQNMWHKPSFRKETNQQLKAQYAHKLQDQYYAAMAHSALQSSPKEESFTRFRGWLVTMFGGHTRQSLSSTSSATTSSIDSDVNLVKETKGNCLLDPKSLVSVISQAVTTSLKLGSQPTMKGGVDAKGTGFVSKPYLGKPRPSQLAPSMDGSLNPE